MDTFEVLFYLGLGVAAIWMGWPWLTSRSSKAPTTPVTVVYLRTVDITPARFMESEVYYDAWGTPYIYGDSHHSSSWFRNTLRHHGLTSNQWLEWKHKSGPDVVFPDKSAPDKGWFPLNHEDTEL